MGGTPLLSLPAALGAPQAGEFDLTVENLVPKLPQGSAGAVRALAVTWRKSNQSLQLRRAPQIWAAARHQAGTTRRPWVRSP